MIRNRVYYAIKPILPSLARLGLRRWYCRRKLLQAGGTWPIFPDSEKLPPNWPGGPDGKKFALILTHDVEGLVGLQRCLQVMQLELGMGFRSSFNFIPEGSYEVSRELRMELERNSFEVGVHDLHHDGRLYSSFRAFSRRAQRINHYLREWGAVGFRSGFMFHNLDWAHQLHILYEASTFDTDPFEPQPDGVGTIFPFWVPGPTGSSGRNAALQTGSLETAFSAEFPGYVELPYTLAQDSTLFLFLGESNPDIWIRKLDWVASNGGMVLLNTHPDYMAFTRTPKSAWEYPVGHYQRLLEYLREKHKGAYWHVTAAELANWYKRSFSPGLRGRSQELILNSRRS
jgi:hypothetical protein